MSDENSFGAVATEAPPSTSAPAEEGTGRGNKKLILAGAALVLVLAVLSYTLFFKGGDPQADNLGAVPHTSAPAPSASAAVTDPAKEPTTVPATEDVQGRNPFITQEAVVAPDPGASSPAPGDSASAPPVAPPAETVTVSLVSVKAGLVTTKVDSKTYKDLAAGDTFGTDFQVYAIFNESCAGLLYGDSSFALCEGGSTTLAKL